MLHAATVVGVYGIKGWVKLRSFTDPMENVLGFSQWFLKDRSGLREAAIAEGRRHGKGLIARLEGIDDRDAAEGLRGTEVWVEAGELPELDQGEFYWHELEGLQVWTHHEGREQLLGEVSHLLETGANDVLVLVPTTDSVDERERLIPYVPDEVVRSIDTKAGRIDVAWHPED